MRYGLPVVNVLHAELRDLPPTHAPERGRTMSFRDALRMEHVTFRYPASDRPSLRDVTLLVRRDTSVGFIGATAGEITLANAIGH
jgi:ABC-type multidrug transport system fused ATPase/permease subunit